MDCSRHAHVWSVYNSVENLRTSYSLLFETQVIFVRFGTADAVEQGGSRIVGLIAVAVACVTSGFSGVYFEMVTRKNTRFVNFAQRIKRFSNLQTLPCGFEMFKCPFLLFPLLSCLFGGQMVPRFVNLFCNKKKNL